MGWLLSFLVFPNFNSIGSHSNFSTKFSTHSNTTHDTLDSETRGSQFAAYTVGYSINILGIKLPIFPELPATWAWMNAGLIDVQSQVCAVAIANDSTEQAVINRRDNEMVKNPMTKPNGNWYGWRWICN